MPKQKIAKSELLNLCWSVFHRDGYNGTSIQKVADAVGLGKAGLLHHFGSKEGLMKAVLLHAREAYGAYILSVTQEELPLEQRLEKMLRRQFRLVRIEQRGCFYANMILETAQSGVFNPQLSDFYLDWMTAVTEMLREKFPPSEAKERAYRYFVDYEGSVLLYKLEKDDEHLQRCVQRAIKMLDTPLQIPEA
ncbi:MAG: TetR/AcrR family transcriptional regulator [Bacteroidota bacterium]